MTDLPLTYILVAFLAIFLLAFEIIQIAFRARESYALAAGGPGAAPLKNEADFYGGLLPEDLLRVKFITGVLSGSVGLAVILMQLSSAQTFGFVIVVLSVLIFLIVFYISFTLPDAIMRLLYERRMHTMNRQLVDAMSVLSLALRSGKNFENALPLVAEEISAPLKFEFNRVVQEMKVGGVPLDRALHRLADRVPIKDMQIFVSTILIVHGIGGSQAEIIDRGSSLIRERLLIMSKCRALTAEGRFTALAISLAPPLILAVNLVINHDMTTKFITHPIGILILVAIAISDFIGYKILTRITTPDF